MFPSVSKQTVAILARSTGRVIPSRSTSCVCKCSLQSCNNYSSTSSYRTLTSAVCLVSEKNLFKPIALSRAFYGSHKTKMVISPEEIEKRNVTFEEVRDGLQNRSLVVIDVREPRELEETGEIEGAINIPLSQLKDGLKLGEKRLAHMFNVDIKRDGANVVFSCRSGKRTIDALQIALKEDFEDARVYQGSWLEWEARGGPIIKFPSKKSSPGSSKSLPSQDGSNKSACNNQSAETSNQQKNKTPVDLGQKDHSKTVQTSANKAENAAEHHTLHKSGNKDEANKQNKHNKSEKDKQKNESKYRNEQKNYNSKKDDHKNDKSERAKTKE